MIEAAQKSRDIRYRADIDGLRAIAVLLVVAYHINPAWSPVFTGWIGKHISNTLAFYLVSGKANPSGGFIGVDIFFVISGFLISGILLREQAANTFSILRFYERRIRRILPALSAALFFVFIASWSSFTPMEMTALCKSILAATFSSANIYFWKSSNYFDGPSLLKLLLHTWSLAVEEQFYLFFPIILLVVHRIFRRHLGAIIIVLTLASFAASVMGVYRDPTATFYLPQTRAWELLVGTIVAMGIIPAPASKVARNLSSLAGLILILFSAFGYTSQTKFPGAAALLPCIGAVLVIIAGITGGSLVGRILSSPPFVFVGLISYSLYLWHWPLLLIDKYEYFPGFRPSQAWLFVIMLIIATLSWRLIEQPFRSGPLKLPRRQLFAAAAVAVTLLTTISLWGLASAGIPSRFTPDELRLARYAENGPTGVEWDRGCFAVEWEPPFQSFCLAGIPGKPNYLLYGDSHAAHLWYGLASVFPEINILQATASSCKPLLGSLTAQKPYCRELADTVFRHFLPAHQVVAVILSAVWEPADIESLADTVAYLHSAHIQVFVVGPIDYYDQPLPDLLIKEARSGDPSVHERHYYRTDSQYRWLDDKISGAALDHGAERYISLRELLCPGESCIQYASPGIPLQFDNMHLTEAGSLLVAQRLRDSHQLP